jgi:hypothetical protein
MANNFFTVHNGLQVGPLTIDAATGNITTTGTITSSSSSNEVFSGPIYANNFYYGNGLAVVSTIYDLDDISNYVDTFTNTFNLTYNQSTVTVLSPWNISVTVNGALQPAWANNIEVLWQSFVLTANKGYSVVNYFYPNGAVQSGPLLKFADPLPRGSQVLIRTVTGTYSQPPKIYPFKPVDIVLGAD